MRQKAEKNSDAFSVTVRAIKCKGSVGPQDLACHIPIIGIELSRIVFYAI